jgi:uncharacterized membrane protein YuzA (DUF378 family)
MSALRAISDVLLIAGGLNWGSIALTNGSFNPVDKMTGGNQLAKNVIYGAVGAAAVYTIVDDVVHGFPRSSKRANNM